MRNTLFLILLLPVIGFSQSTVLESNVSFEVNNMWVNTVEGTFGEVKGKAVFSKSNPENSIFDLSVKATTVNTGNEKRDEHLRTGDFFDVKNHPLITISGTDISKVDNTTYSFTGTVTMKGITKPFETNFTVDEMNGDKITLSSQFTIDRTDFRLGESHGGFVISDEIEVIVILVISP